MGYLLWIVIFYVVCRTAETEFVCPGREPIGNEKIKIANCHAKCENVNKTIEIGRCIPCKYIWLNQDNLTAEQFLDNNWKTWNFSCSIIRFSDFDKEERLYGEPHNGLMVGGTEIIIVKRFSSFDPVMEPAGTKCKNVTQRCGNWSCITPALVTDSKKQNLTFIQHYVKYFFPFEYLENPRIRLNEPITSYYWGKRQLKFEWKLLPYIKRAELFLENQQIYSSKENCTIGNTIDCPSPRIMDTKGHSNTSTEIILILKMDTFKKEMNLIYFPNPKFEEKALMDDTNITIKGHHLTDSADETEYKIVAGSEICSIKILQFDQIVCTLPDSEFEGSINITLHCQTKTLKVEKIIPYIWFVIGGVCFFLLLLAIILIIYYMTTSRKKEKKWFVSSADYSRQLMTIIVRHGIPFQNSSNYMKRILWTLKPPGNIRYDTQNMSENLKQTLEKFGLLLKNKYFLLPALKALEKDKSLTQNQKFTYAYHLSILFSSDLCYFLECCEELFIHLVSQNRGAKSKKLMSRSSSITEYLIFNWIGITMYSSIKDIGDILYFFNEELKNYFEKMPIDEVTGNTYKCLFEKYKMTSRTSYEEIKIHAVFNDEIKTVTVFTCDSIVQLKKKCLEAFYQGQPISKMPDVDDIYVEYTTSKIDEFKSEENSKGFTQHLTIDNWSIQSDNLLKLKFCKQRREPEENADERYVTLGSPVARITTKSNRKFIHLQEPPSLKDEQPLTKKDVKKIELPVNVEHKLMQLMNKFLEAGRISDPLLCLYNMFKKAASKSGEEKRWFLNSYFIQFCCQFIAEPTILLDISQEVYMKKNLEGIKNYTIYLMERYMRNSCSEPELCKNVTDFFSKISARNANVKELLCSLVNISADIKRDIRFCREHSLYYLFKMMKTNYSLINSALVKEEKACRLQLSEQFIEVIENIEIGQIKRDSI